MVTLKLPTTANKYAHHRRLRGGHLLRHEDPPREGITHQVDGFVALVGLNTIDRNDDPAVFFHLCQPRLILLCIATRP